MTFWTWSWHYHGMRFWRTLGRDNYILHVERTLLTGGQWANCGRQLQKWANDISLLILMPLYNASSCVRAGPHDLLLTDRIQQKWWAITPRLGYTRLWLVLFSDSGLLCWRKQPCWKLPCLERNKSTALRNSVLQTTTWMAWNESFPPAELGDDCSLVRNFKAENPAKLHPDS